MNHEEARKLLGGYATGSLTESERKALFAAALDDQALFDELADEQSLKELLDEPGVRERLLAGLAPKVKNRSWGWQWAGVAGALLGCALIAIVWVNLPKPPAAIEMSAKVNVPVPPVAPQVDSSPAAAPEQVAPAVPKAEAPAAAPTRDAARNQPVPQLKRSAKSSAPLDSLSPAPISNDASNRRDAPTVGAEAPKAEKSVATAAAPPAPSIFEPINPQRAQRAKLATPSAKSVPVPAAEVAPPVVMAQSLVDTGQVPGLQKDTAAAGAAGAFGPPAGGGGRGGARGGGRGGFVQVQTFGFRYQVNETMLQVTPTSIGWLTVTTADAVPVTLFSNRMVPSSVPLAIPVPADAKELTIQFASESGPVNETPVRRTTLSGLVAADSKAAITIPAHP